MCSRRISGSETKQRVLFAFQLQERDMLQRLRDELDSAATKHNVDRDALRDAQRKNESLATEVS